MRSYYAHLKTGSSESKPVFRSSALFPVIQDEGIATRILFLSYWFLKRNIKEVTAVVSLRNEQGALISRQQLTIDQSKGYRIEVAEYLALGGLPPEVAFRGSIEVEFFSLQSLVFPYPALLINYYGPAFCSVVHTAERVYNDLEDMANNSQTQVPESGFNIHVDEEREPFVAVVNGPQASSSVVMNIEFMNSEGNSLDHAYSLGDLSPYQMVFLLLAKEVNLKDFFNGKVGTAKVRFHLDWIYPRIIAGNIQRTLPALSITHTYYDCSQSKSSSDYWFKPEKEWYPASLMVPLWRENETYTKAYFYPIYSPKAFSLDLEIYDKKGTLLRRKEEVLIFEENVEKFAMIDFQVLCQEFGILHVKELGARIIAKSPDGTPLPARIKLGLDMGMLDRGMPCNICTNLQPFNPSLEHKPSSFKWAPVLVDQPYSSIWIMNSSPKIEFSREAEITLHFYRESDTHVLIKKMKVAPNGFAVISPNSDAKLRSFMQDRPGWMTVQTSNAYTTTYYLATNPSGVIGGDHGF